MMARPVVCAGLLCSSIACTMLRGPAPPPVSDQPGVAWSCSDGLGAAESLAGSIASWARTQARDTLDGTVFRVSHGMSGERDVEIIHDPALCARAGRAYAHGDSIRPFHYHIALVRVGRRYVTINPNDVHRAGEFMLEAVLEEDFRFVEWLGT